MQWRTRVTANYPHRMTDRDVARRVLRALEDVRASAQDALLALERDPTFSDAGAEGYAAVRSQVAVGLEQLSEILDHLEGAS